MDKIRIVIADDHNIFRKGVRALLDSLPNMEVIGEAENGQEVVQIVGDLQPDIVLMDIQMPNMNGFEATREIINRYPNIGIIMLTMFDDDNSTFSAMRAGARGYILKGASQAEMIRTIEGVASGQAVFDAGVAMQMVNFFANTKTNDPFPELTEREHEVLKLIADGFSNSEIADQLTISPKTLRNHISNIFSKLQVTDRMQAIKRARDAGFHTE